MNTINSDIEYQRFLESKQFREIKEGFEIELEQLNSNMFDFQKVIVKWALKKGRCALFTTTGSGKTLMQLEFANQVCNHTNGSVLLVAPLAISRQTKRESEKFGIQATLCRTQEDVQKGINITNYEMLEHFNADFFNGVVLDESSIIKNFNGKTTDLIINSFKNTPFKLACTATPSPNDYVELGTHAEFLGVMSRAEMLATFFVHDMSNTQSWRLKGHAEDKFFEWLASFCMLMTHPRDLGYETVGYDLPKLNINEIIIESEREQDSFFPKVAQTLTERRVARKESMQDRINKTVDLLGDYKDKFIVWCDFNAEQDTLEKQIGKNNCVSIQGSTKDENKILFEEQWRITDIPVMITKPKVFSQGMNWQHCNNMIFCGLSDSFEQFYQAIRRCWRFGQTKEVNVYVVISEKEIATLENIKRKEKEHQRLTTEMVKLMSDILKHEIKSTQRNVKEYITDKQINIPNWIKGE